MENKICSKCKKIKSIKEFGKEKKVKNELRSQCKSCFVENRRQYYMNNLEKVKENCRQYRINNLEKFNGYSRTFYINHPEKIRIKNRQYRINNPEKVKELNKKWAKNNPERVREINREWSKRNSEKVREKSKKWIKNNPEKARELNIKCSKKWRENNPDYMQNWWKNNHKKLKIYTSKRMENPKNKLSKNIRTYMGLSLKGNKNGRCWEDLVGYNLQNLMIHLEKLFKPGMTWDNYGMKGWSIDHIKPISKFNFVSYEDEEFKECWALENLQPLWHKENISKGAKYEM